MESLHCQRLAQSWGPFHSPDMISRLQVILQSAMRPRQTLVQTRVDCSQTESAHRQWLAESWRPVHSPDIISLVGNPSGGRDAAIGAGSGVSGLLSEVISSPPLDGEIVETISLTDPISLPRAILQPTVTPSTWFRGERFAFRRNLLTAIGWRNRGDHFTSLILISLARLILQRTLMPRQA